MVFIDISNLKFKTLDLLFKSSTFNRNEFNISATLKKTYV